MAAFAPFTRSGELVVARRPVPIVLSLGSLVPIALLALLFVASSSGGSPFVVLAVGLFGGIGGAVSLVVHELGHVGAARRLTGVRPTAVSLIWLGAATRFEGAYRSGREQVRVAAGGPLASTAFALMLLVVAFAAAPLPIGLRYAAFGLGVLNLLLAVLNFLPVKPLDGHKLLVGLSWWVAGSEARGKAIARRIGHGWLAIELVSAAGVLLFATPALGAVVGVAAVAFFAQNRLGVRRAR